MLLVVRRLWIPGPAGRLEAALRLGRPEEARPHFLRAHALLSKDPWLARDEAPRLERLKRLGEGAAE